MIKLQDFLKCVNIDEFVFEINRNKFDGKEIYQYYYLSEINTMKISKIYMSQNNMITAVIDYD